MAARRWRLLTLATLIAAAGILVSAQRARMPQRANGAGPTTFNADIDGDRRPDVCRLEARPKGAMLLCTLARNGRDVRSEVLDPGYPEGRAFVDFDGDGKQDYCRVIGTAFPNSFAACTLSLGERFAPQPIVSASLDWGYPESREWKDVNGDGKADFCRVVGNNRESLACTFSTGTGFGRTVVNPR